METLKEIIEKHTPAVLPDADQVAVELDALRQAEPYHCELPTFSDVREDLTNKFFESYFRGCLSDRYRPISEELFSLRRQIRVRATDRGIGIPREINTKDLKFDPATIPAFAVINYGARQWDYTGLVQGAVSKTDYNNRKIREKKQFEFRVFVNAPLLTSRVKAEAAEAMAFAYEVCASTLRNPAALRNLMYHSAGENDTPEQIITDVTSPELKVLWKPNAEDLIFKLKTPEPPNKDPALLLCFNKAHYLVTTWDIPNESPFRHYLKEFTTGNTPKPTGHLSAPT